MYIEEVNKVVLSMMMIRLYKHLMELKDAHTE